MFINGKVCLLTEKKKQAVKDQTRVARKSYPVPRGGSLNVTAHD